MNTVNMHSLQKKVRRFGQSIRQLTGLSTKVRSGFLGQEWVPRSGVGS